jgi:hypothetical protein
MATVMQKLRNVAMALPNVEEGVACEGTAIEKRTVKVNGRAFLFLGRGDALLKLGPSLASAQKLAAASPGRVRAGAGGWVKLVFTEAEPPPMAVVTKWIAESYRLMTAGPAKKTAAKPKTKKRAKKTRE